MRVISIVWTGVVMLFVLPLSMSGLSIVPVPIILISWLIIYLLIELIPGRDRSLVRSHESGRSSQPEVPPALIIVQSILLLSLLATVSHLALFTPHLTTAVPWAPDNITSTK